MNIDKVGMKFHKFHEIIADILKKLIHKKHGCSDRVLLWMRKAVSLNLEKMKYHTNMPTASDGFVLNMIDTLFILCKPFTADFSKYHKFINKINCFYLSNDK